MSGNPIAQPIPTDPGQWVVLAVVVLVWWLGSGLVVTCALLAARAVWTLRVPRAVGPPAPAMRTGAGHAGTVIEEAPRRRPPGGPDR